MAYNHRKAELEWLNWKEKEEKQLRELEVKGHICPHTASRPRTGICRHMSAAACRTFDALPFRMDGEAAKGYGRYAGDIPERGPLLCSLCAV